MESNKPFVTHEGCSKNSDIMSRDDEETITDQKKIVQLFNDHYINIVERSCGFKPEKVEFDFGSCNKDGVSSSILDKYRNHPSIVKLLSPSIIIMNYFDQFFEFLIFSCYKETNDVSM